MLRPEPVTLRGQLVSLEPLTLDHVEALHAAAAFPELWRYALAPMLTLDDVAAYVSGALDGSVSGFSIPFVQRCLKSGEIVGSTRFGNIDVFNRRVEIGWTWLTPAMQRSGINTEAKLLLLSHAFETLGALRVEFKGDARNEKSRNALERIGAKLEGILRQHMRNADGTQRDSFYYSVIAGEWPETKLHIQGLLRSDPQV